jgi:hypothetical protein
MDTLNALAAAPDGKSIVGTAAGADAVVDFPRGAGGVLSLGSCISSDTATSGCAGTFSNSNTGAGTALDNANGIAISPDNANVYVAGGSSDAVSVIGRNTTTGAIEGFEGCRTSDPATTGCAFDPGSATTSHMSSLEGLAVNGDGSKLYAASSVGDALTLNDRRASDGAFFFKGCITSNANLAHCAQISPNAPGGTNTPLQSSQAVVPSQDGKDVYVISSVDTISQFEFEGVRPPVVEPPGGDGDPPGANPPANDITISGIAKNKRKGTAQLTVSVPGAGALGLAGNGLKPQAATAAGASDVTLKVKTTGNKRKKLRRKGKIKVTPLVTFTPTGGTANTESTKVKLVDR